MFIDPVVSNDCSTAFNSLKSCGRIYVTSLTLNSLNYPPYLINVGINFYWFLVIIWTTCFNARSQNCEKRLLTSSFLSDGPFVCPSAWNKSAATGRIFIKFHTSFFRKFVANIQASLKSDKNNGYFTWRPVCIYGNILLNSSYNDKCFRQKL